MPSLAVYEAEPGAAAAAGAGGYRDGFTGALVLQGVEAFTQEEAGRVLARLGHVVR
ncbi:hypothetical protein ABIB35_003103, partial [Arthrobacter sp. UYP6]